MKQLLALLLAVGLISGISLADDPANSSADTHVEHKESTNPITGTKTVKNTKEWKAKQGDSTQKHKQTKKTKTTTDGDTTTTIEKESSSD